MTSLRELGEPEILSRLRALCAPGEGVELGPGDDGAVLRVPVGREVVATTDSMVEGVHWEPAWMSPEQIGGRAAAANLSDLAAMAAKPAWALVGYGVSEETTWEWLEGCQRGLVATLGQFGASLVGGNVTRVSAEPWIHLTLLGLTESGAAWKRSGAQPGDVLALTGPCGHAGAAVRLIRALGSVARRYPTLLEAWRAPQPRCMEAQALARVGAVRAAIDVSDGLSSDLASLCAASGVGAILEEPLLPLETPLEQAARELGVEPLKLQLGPSDDYELLLALDPSRWTQAADAAASVGLGLIRIGAVKSTLDGIWLRDSIGMRHALSPAGWDHFRRS